MESPIKFLHVGIAKKNYVFLSPNKKGGQQFWNLLKLKAQRP